VARNPLKEIINTKEIISFFIIFLIGGSILTYNLLIMKLKKIFFISSNNSRKQSGQGVVEYVLLLAVISSITYLFVGFMNKNLARYWEHAANLVVNDKPGIKTVTLDK